MDDARISRSRRLFLSILDGKTSLNSRNTALFLEAISVQEAPVPALAKLLTRADLYQTALWADQSVSFFNKTAAPLLDFFRQAPELKLVQGGQSLQDFVVKTVEPPIFWDAFVKALRSGHLQEGARLGFSWLLLQLVSLPPDQAQPYRALAEDTSVLDILLASANSETRTYTQSIKHVVETRGVGAAIDDDGPGGRHDNDFPDFRSIAILPTADEIYSKRKPFLRTADDMEDVDESQRTATHLDNQYRLLREDMLYELRNELQIALGEKKGHHRGLVVEGLKIQDLHGEPSTRNPRWGLQFQCREDLWFFRKDKPKNRPKYLKDNPKLVRDGSLVCLLVDNEIVAFPTISRDEELLSKTPPIFALQFDEESSATKTLTKLRGLEVVKLIQIDTAIFSYKPVLEALKAIKAMPLAPEIILWKEGSTIPEPPLGLSISHITRALIEAPYQDLRPLLGTPKAIKLDDAQAASLLMSLTRRVSLIQGPPGTGKSFIGALLAKIFHDKTAQTILVCCYTNHALDQFLEDLLDIGIPQGSLVRLGGRTTARTEPLSLYSQKSNFRFGRADWAVIDPLKNASQVCFHRLRAAFERYMRLRTGFSGNDLMSFLEFEHDLYYEAFRVPSDEKGMTRVGKGGKAADPQYLVMQWIQGKNAGMYLHEPFVRQAREIWAMSRAERDTQLAEWRDTMLRQEVESFYQLASQYNEYQEQLGRKFKENETTVLRTKRIIGCTTTAAAKYSQQLQEASPHILIVEEAGEILESHVLTALGQTTERLILIGDHQQLRPKVNNYLLTVEKGEGYDFNKSVFERMVLKGYPHKTLLRQHRMRPEIAELVRFLTYSDLIDADSTKGRPDLRGVLSNIVFIEHAKPEDVNAKISDGRDEGSKSSKQNTHEVQMVLKILRYLAQQGYGTSQVVILTPYLGQLHLLRDALKKDNDPVLNDLDSYDLIRAGLLQPAAASVSKNSIRLATIDNYQGEESDIVILSLTRSNPNHDIGFMFSPERLNVLLSRSRNALIMIGNAETFMKSRKGGELWTRLLDFCKLRGYIYGGLPVKCERHPDRQASLREPEDFDNLCPDGGCSEPCGTMLKCGLHTCPSKCHQLADHSKMACDQIMHDKCSAGHPLSWKCQFSRPLVCRKCERAAALAEKKQKEAFEAQRLREVEQQKHIQQLAELEEQIRAEQEKQTDVRLTQERQNALRQKIADLEEARARTLRTFTTRAAPVSSHANPPSTSTQSSPPTSLPQVTPAEPQQGARDESQQTPPPPPAQAQKILEQPPISVSQQEWQRQKDMEGADNTSIDAIMEMVGLEEVKAQVLAIKAKIDLGIRQGTSVKDERFNVVLQGNPGTGKTTVARHYAKFLTSLGVLPGDEFIETTGSKLANEGVPGIQKQLETVLNAGGGTIFIDEAYQLTSAHNFGGGPVLDFLLAEMENNVGKLVFILAGYNKQMEKFFEHNPGLTSRVPYQLQFADYSDAELLTMLVKRIEKKYGGRMRVEGGMRGLGCRIAITRLGRGRGREGFGNARALQNMFDKVTGRQATRIARQRREGLAPDDMLLVQEDLIGPDPSQAVLVSKSWTKLHEMIGLKEVKESVQNLFNIINTNYQRELREKEPVQVSLNRVFIGSPGTGKTTVAKLYGQILADLALLSNGEVVVKNPADFIGNVLGASESNTKAILATTVGKVLVIDEAYMLYGGKSAGSGNTDSFKTAVIDTMVAEIQSVPGEDRCVLLLGYEKEIRDMFQNVNPGLSRRFAIEEAFKFADFNDAELTKILELKLKQGDLAATDNAKRVAIEVLGRERNRPNFGNGGAVENLLSGAKGRYQARQAKLPLRERSMDIVFEPQDFDLKFDRAAHSGANLKALFADVIGCEKIVEKLEGYQNIARSMKTRGRVVRPGLIPTNFVFKGPPGTGKTTTARKMGEVYYDMGILSSVDVVECSASDLVGEYVGQTGPKTQRLFTQALGKVLFIDEAYRLAEGHFAKEAIDELVSTLTLEAFAGKLVVILAGYDQDINKLLDVNAGLSSRFPEVILFENMSAEACLRVIAQELKENDITSAELADPAGAYAAMVEKMRELARGPSWGNARDAKTLANAMAGRVWGRENVDVSGDVPLHLDDALACMDDMLRERHERSTNLPTPQNPFADRMQRAPPQPPTLTPPAISTAQSAATTTAPPASAAPAEQADGRDAGVSDQIWRQLQADKKAALDAAKRKEEETRALEAALAEARREEARAEEARRAAEAELERRAMDAAKANELKRRLELERIAAIERRRELERMEALLEERRRQEQEEREREREAQAQAKLRSMGVCVAGYRWIKQSSGYRCAGGTHFVSDAQLGL
ncbi:P-loop containing nucleoside triphosphate hydrolase protein [Auriscalpium vulgare]|uniref:P-loop containing nucleoside triphosphate hydrolase protein n=1 Tax=Auriscalpium vulgare TaxID=40419 RepID=A0ACB8S2D7_9AGAM|nr:P-loop containing nucleoside triphosphate hydrolase protein [Auriscalpium vulgare]